MTFAAEHTRSSSCSCSLQHTFNGSLFLAFVDASFSVLVSAHVFFESHFATCSLFHRTAPAHCKHMHDRLAIITDLVSGNILNKLVV